MKYIDINRKFTERVNQYLASGYIFNSASMRGSQGERAHIDLTNGTEIIRILVTDFSAWTDTDHLEGVEVIAGRVPSNTVPHVEDDYNTIWNQELEILSRDRFYVLGESRKSGKFYGTEEEALAASKTRIEHWVRKARSNAPSELPLTAERMKIAKHIIRNRLGVKRRINEADVRVCKSSRGYTVSYKAKACHLG
ncbi:hypothetical protein [uncultured Dysosmobacter sp.]|uniref:hypothetical protein n=1 Tax=uncultured Dysosmobacter sp. TaxID=2591384 RepID=UPI0026161CCC|nr:hypothetical protein [uncultured Dysosmobacter sp.]